MSEKSRIEWTDATWNPVTGCSKVSPGCQHCYAERLSLRQGWSHHPWTASHAEENVVVHPDRLLQPMRWPRPRSIFVNSMSDLFHDQVPTMFLDQVFAVMAFCYDVSVVTLDNVVASCRPRHRFQVLTKRPQRQRDYLSDLAALAQRPASEQFASSFAAASRAVSQAAGHPIWPNAPFHTLRWIRDGFPGLWVGVSVEDQRRADERIPLLLQTPAPIRFLSCEPLLGPVDLSAFQPFSAECFCQDSPSGCRPRQAVGCPVTGVDWVITGAESGPQARPMDDDWVRTLRDQCTAAGVPFFFKQRVEHGRKLSEPVLDGRVWSEMPQDA